MRPDPPELPVIGEARPDKVLLIDETDDDGNPTRLRWVETVELELPRDRPDASAEYEALTRAAQTSPPPCVGDTRFVDDRVPAPIRKALAATCKSCPIRSECFAYANIAHPAAGIWAGWIFT